MPSWMDFPDLKNQQAAILDVTSLGWMKSLDKVIFDRTETLAFIETMRRCGAAACARELNILNRLCYLLCFRHLAVDAYALNQHEDARDFLERLQQIGFGQIVFPVTIPREVYVAAIERWWLMQRELGQKKKIEKRYPETRTTDDGAIARVHNDFIEREWNMTVGFSETGLGPERLLIYLEAVESAGVPVVLDPSKEEGLSALGEGLWQDTVKCLQRNLTEAVYQDISAHWGERVSFVASIPPLPLYILREAERRNLSIAETILAIRNDEVATAFQDYLWKFEQAIREDRLMEVKQFKQELDSIAQRIARAGGPEGIRYDEVPLTQTNIPFISQISQILDILGLEGAAIRRTKRAAPYAIFMARWFRSSNY